VVVNLLFGQSVVLLTQRTVRKVLREMEAALLADEVHQHLARWRELVTPLIGKQPKDGARGRQSAFISVAALRRLTDALVILEALPETNAMEACEVLARKVRSCRAALEGDGERHGTQGDSKVATGTQVAAAVPFAPAVLACEAALAAFQREIEQPGAAPAAAAHKRQLFVPDAFTNPAHWQFALKTTLAVMVVYFIYTMLDWPGMRTSIVTCFFVALGSLGETVHKLVLRISGALIGGLIAGLCIVFVLPHMTDIGELCLLIAVVSAGAAWVATSSELLAYAGLQIAFAFFLGILQGYAPATDLTVLRDRVAGILLGNLVMTLVFTLLWPQSATSKFQAAVTEALGAIGEVRNRSGDPAEARVRTAQALVRAHQFNLVRRFELSMLPKRSRESVRAPQVTEVERSAGEAFVATYDIT
jgi:multidrug resistance protein MdtO